MKSPTIFSLFFFLILIIGIIAPVHAQPLNLTVTTSKEVYDHTETVLIYGNLSSNGELKNDALIGLEVRDQEAKLLTIRTVTTGEPPSITLFVEILSIVHTRTVGGLVYFDVTIRNNDIQPRQVLVTINTYDANNISFGYTSTKTTLPKRWEGVMQSTIPLGGQTTTGNATAYANAYTYWPREGELGIPYCSEVSTTFPITSGGSLNVPPSPTPQVTGNYNLTFQLPLDARGTYTIYASAEWHGYKTFNSTTFNVEPWYMDGDLNGDVDVDFWDTVHYVDAYIEYGRVRG